MVAMGLGKLQDIKVFGPIAQLGPRINVSSIVSARGNLPSGTVWKPRDVVNAMNGNTIEVISTDAEGRLILADALGGAPKEGLASLIDLATLTVACRVILDTPYSGVFDNGKESIGEVLKAVERTGERIWQMPMSEEYKDQVKSEIADIRNTRDKYGGAITAALFLAQFVANVPWGHIDIAGTAFPAKQTGHIARGTTRVGVRTLVELALSDAENQEAA
jgi:leucyl aminopeptidase